MISFTNIDAIYRQLTSDRALRAAVVLKKPLTAQEDRYFEMGKRLCQEGFIAAKRGDMAQSSSRLRTSAIVASRLPRFGVAWVSFTSSYAAAVAYLCYKLEMHEKAIQALREANTADLLLVQVFGYHEMHLHRVHLVHNMARVELKRGNFAGATNLAAALIEHLCGREESVLSKFGPWSYDLCETCSSTDRDEMLARLQSDLEQWQSLAAGVSSCDTSRSAEQFV